ncbi:MAG: hypothetical protein K1X31_07590 [Gemmatimonadaceae bacterium]|nr:hypothetical protein [Gemmatimonadaceae bacterium]
MSPDLATVNRIVISLVLLFGAAIAIRRAGAYLRAELARTSAPPPMPVTKEQLAAVTEQGLATPEQFFTMTEKEQQLLLTTATLMRTAQHQRPTRAQ